MLCIQDHKPNNVLTGEHIEEVKLCDLGCCSFGPNERGLVTKGLGPDLYNVRTRGVCICFYDFEECILIFMTFAYMHPSRVKVVMVVTHLVKMSHAYA